MENFHIITGENEWQIDQEVARWKSVFIDKYGAENLEYIDTESVSWLELVQAVSSAPFIAEKRLLILSDFPKCTEEACESFLHSLHPQVVVLIKNPKIDKRLKTHKLFLKEAVVKECTVPAPAAIRTWLQEYAKMHGAELSKDTAEFLLQKVGANQYILANEVQKLSLCTKNITKAEIQALSVAMSQQEIWGLTACLGKGDIKKSIEYIQHLLEQGESPMGVWTIFLWIITNIQQMMFATIDGVQAFQPLMKGYKVGFGPAKSCAPIVQALTQSGQYKDFFTEVEQLETAMKNGGLQSTVSDSSEIISCIYYVALRLCSFSKAN